MAGTTFAMIVEDPDTTAIIDFQDICWPYRSTARARHMAMKVGALGIWRIKPKHRV